MGTHVADRLIDLGRVIQRLNDLVEDPYFTNPLFPGRRKDAYAVFEKLSDEEKQDALMSLLAGQEHIRDIS